MLSHLLIAVAAIVGLMFTWLAVQGLKHRSDPGGETVLDCGTCGAHSCGGCTLHENGAHARR